MLAGSRNDIRFIPAPAGNTRHRRPLVPSTTVHPRACGEHEARVTLASSARGSSPRLRGTQWCARRRHPRRRFIPAPAGNTQRIAIRWDSITVHPRACGEHHGRPPKACSVPGSSPRLRGTRESCSFLPRRSRFIPAPAGNTVTRTILPTR